MENEKLIEAILDAKYDEMAQLDEDMQQKNAAMVDYLAKIDQKDAEIHSRELVIRQMDDEIHFMRSSKFWKIRNRYFRYRLYLLNPFFVARKLLFAWRILVQDDTHKEKQQRTIKASAEDYGFQPKVSVIVPNYNHAKFLRQRLDSIYKQTYKNIEVILLDDKSSDDSRDILKTYYKRYKDKTRCIFNEKNSGNVFTQWKRGIAAAKGELIWIAESDDSCDSNFLEELVKQFEDESIMLAYAHPVFIDETGKPSGFTFESYTEELSTTKWKESYVASAAQEVREALGIKNTIPNVSGVVFRNIPTDEFNYDSLKQFRVCGDWYFYLSIIRGGKLAYVRSTSNYYRFHSSNTSSNYQKNIGFVKEHENVAKHVARNYKVSAATLRRQSDAVRFVWNTQNPGKEEQFDQAYNFSKVKKEMHYRKPNILMAIYAFTTGGGETVPVRLANQLKAKDYNVTIFEYDRAGKDQHTIRGMLKKSIPVATRIRSDLDKTLKDFDIELVHSHHAWVDVVVSTRKDKSIPHVVTTHGMYEALPKKVVDEFEKHIRKVSSWVYVADKNLKPLMKYRWFRSKPRVKISNGFLPVKPKKVTRRQLGINQTDFVVCLASRALGDKGWREAIDAVKLANATSRRHITLVLIGDGPIYDELKKRSRDKNGDYIALGFRENVSDYFSMADLGILPTKFKGESCPMTLIECLSAGRPFLSTNIGEIKSMLTLKDGSVAGEVLDLKDGRIDMLKLVKSLVKFANDREYYEERRQNALLRRSRFSMELVVAHYEKVYKDLLIKN